jgi:hypothetical protein
MAEYWLVSAPGEKTPQQTYEALKTRMVGLSPVWKFSIPELKVMACQILFWDYCKKGDWKNISYLDTLLLISATFIGFQLLVF